MRFEIWNLKLAVRRVAALFLRCALYCISAGLLLTACAQKQIPLPSYEGVPVEEALAELRDISSIEALLSLRYEKGDTMMSGDAALTLTESRLSLKVFYLGFLAAELTEEAGVVRSKPHLDRVKSTMLVEGMRSSLLWWNIRDYTIDDTGRQYVIRNAHRELVLDKETLLPSRQALYLDNGESIIIEYASPARAEFRDRQNGEQLSEGSRAAHFLVFASGLWYPSEMTIGFRNQVAHIKVTSLTVLN